MLGEGGLFLAARFRELRLRLLQALSALHGRALELGLGLPEAHARNERIATGRSQPAERQSPPLLQAADRRNRELRRGAAEPFVECGHGLAPTTLAQNDAGTWGHAACVGG